MIDSLRPSVVIYIYVLWWIDGFTGDQVNKDDQISKWSKKFDELANKLAAQHDLALASLPSEPLTP